MGERRPNEDEHVDTPLRQIQVPPVSTRPPSEHGAEADDAFESLNRALAHIGIEIEALGGRRTTGCTERDQHLLTIVATLRNAAEELDLAAGPRHRRSS